ncbi:Nuclear transport factor 2 Eukaryote [Penicillium robsamsonii]|uniref:Nuclear transport factor 2 Eukaryote n=1 Tax=Penicillium robsamsonii TaxID=1792511 RepID=UPI0025484A0F|nr:Nuclear transport factor 2 Eukaryote [Penicillium robsamsonii]KAJ5823938.1 Nuclear transport factor 2 Eukaryote [Penicillium robsamsonii]
MKSMKPRRGGNDRGGIRKRGATRTDRDGDMDMEAGGARGKRNRADKSALGGRAAGTGAGGRAAGTGNRAQTRNRLMDADVIQRAISSADGQANIHRGGRKKTGGDLEPFSVRGWKESKAASNRDGGLESLIAFLERRMNSFIKSGPRAKITKSRTEGDTLVAFVRPDLAGHMLRINNNVFAGAHVTIEPYTAATALDNELAAAAPTPGSTADTKLRMTTILGKRFFPATKLLDLSKMVDDPELHDLGVFDTMSTTSKFFPALMKVWEMGFKVASERREAVESVSLAGNNLSNITSVTTLAQSFPDIQYLDLSNNNIKNAQAMTAWRWKFRNLIFLDLTDNEISSDPTFKDTMLKWYPKLQTLNNVQVRTPEEVAAQKKTPIPVLPPHFIDESQVGENFVRAFFPGYDTDRNSLVSSVYDDQSTFSLNVNTTAPRAGQTETAGWGEYIRKSRNLDKISHLSARMSRSFKGVEKIREVFNELPPTRHPDLVAKAEQWLIECHPVPHLPDPTGQSPTGVGGLSLMVHGQLEESVGGKIEIRSFDRTFIIGPGNTPGGIRVVSEIFCLRAYGGHEAWSPEIQALSQVPQVAAPGPVSTATPTPPAAVPSGTVAEGYGLPRPGKSDTQLQQEQMITQMSAKSGMTFEYSEMALAGNGWNPELAWKNFEQLKATNALPPTAFLAPA